MAVAALDIRRTKSLYEAARECIDEANGDRAEAAKTLRHRIDVDGDLRREMIEPMLDKACWNQIRAVAHKERRPYWSESAASVNEDKAAGVRSVAVQHARQWLDYPLSCGKRLADATNADVIAEAEMHDMNARTNAIRAAFYRKIATAMQDAEKVSDVLTNNQLDQFASEVSHVA